MEKKNYISPQKICAVAVAIVINLIGGQLALMLKLPIYLDSIGTIFIGAILGPVYGMIPNLLSGVIMGMTVDVYSLYYAPVGMIVGLVAGLVCHKKLPNKAWGLLAALIITVPGTILSSCITAFLFGGITSSGSTILVQLLEKTPLSMTASVFIVQFFTDYLDRVIALYLALVIFKALPTSLKEKIKR